jgi:hypothetical protein
MGQISGVDASLITSIAGVAVANISYVGPTSAATIGLGGGGRVFTVQYWSEPLDACTNGENSILESGSQTLYENEGIFYIDSSFQDRFNGQGAWFWCQTNNISYAIGEKGETKNTSVCQVVTGLVFTVDWWNAEEGSSNACLNGQRAIDKNGSQLLYQNGEMFYVDAEYTTLFNGMDVWWWCQTNNTSYKIATEGNIVINNPCGGGNTLKTFANFIWENTESICFQGPEIIIEVGTITLYYNQGENRMYNNEIFTEPFSGTGLYYYNQTDNQWWQISGEGYVGATGTCS